MSWWAKFGARWCHGTKSLDHVAKSQNTPLHTKSVTPEVILFRMFHTASCFLSACPMPMSVPNSFTLHDIHARTLQPFVHSYPPLAIDTIWVWLIRQCIGLCQLLTSKSFATSSNHKNPPNWNLQMHEPYLEYDTTWSWSSLNFGDNTPNKKNKIYISTKVVSENELKPKKPWSRRCPLRTLVANPSQRPELDCQPWWGAPRNTPDKSSAATQLFGNSFFFAPAKGLGRGGAIPFNWPILWMFSMLNVFKSSCQTEQAEKMLSYEEYSTC